MSALSMSLQPYEIEHDEEEGEYKVSHPVIHAFGEGETEEEAIDDYWAMAADIYMSLSRSIGNLSATLERQYNALTIHLKQEGLLEE